MNKTEGGNVVGMPFNYYHRALYTGVSTFNSYDSCWYIHCTWVTRLVYDQHSDQLSLAIPLWVGANRHTMLYNGPLSVVLQCKLVTG